MVESNICRNFALMISRILKFIKEHPSYLRKSVRFLAVRFKCSENTIRKVLEQLEEERKVYNNSLKKNNRYV